MINPKLLLLSIAFSCISSVVFSQSMKTDSMIQKVNIAVGFLNNDEWEKLIQSIKELDQAGSSYADVFKAILTLNGLAGYKKDIPAGVALFEKAATRGNEYAMSFMGNTFYEGIFVPKNYDISRKWLEKLATLEKLEDDGHLILALHYCYGLGGPQKEELGVKWLKSLAENSKMATAAYELGLFYSDKQFSRSKELDAFYWFRKAADANHEKAQYKIGELYETGGEGLKKDYSEALSWYKRSIGNGGIDAYKKIAELYEKGGYNLDNDEISKVAWKARYNATKMSEEYLLAAEKKLAEHNITAKEKSDARTIQDIMYECADKEAIYEDGTALMIIKETPSKRWIDLHDFGVKNVSDIPNRTVIQYITSSHSQKALKTFKTGNQLNAFLMRLEFSPAAITNIKMRKMNPKSSVGMIDIVCHTNSVQRVNYAFSHDGTSYTVLDNEPYFVKKFHNTYSLSVISVPYLNKPGKARELIAAILNWRDEAPMAGPAFNRHW